MKSRWLTTMAVCLLTTCKASNSICMMKPLKNYCMDELLGAGYKWASSVHWIQIWKDLNVCGQSCYSILATIKVNILYDQCLISGIFQHMKRLFILLFCISDIICQRSSIYEIQSMEGWKQGVMLHKAVWVSNKPQNRMWATVSESFRCYSCLYIYTENVKLW